MGFQFEKLAEIKETKERNNLLTELGIWALDVAEFVDPILLKKTCGQVTKRTEIALSQAHKL